MRILMLLLLAATALLGCPPTGGEKKGTTGPVPCAKVGDSCEFSPGKLGTCVSKDDGCKTPPCLTCQSQH